MLIARKINNRAGTIKAQAGVRSLAWAFALRAGDENRTPTISLGSGMIFPRSMDTTGVGGQVLGSGGR
jgi:hypothetical protein